MPTILNTIARSNVIAGARDDTFRVSGRPTGAGTVQNATIAIPNAEMLTIGTVPVELVAAAPALHGIVVVSIELTKAADAYGGNRVMTFRHGSAGVAWGTVGALTFANAAALTVHADPSLPTADFPTIAATLNATASGNYTGAGGDVSVTVKYIVIEDA